MNLTISGQFELTMVQVIGEQRDTNKIRDICCLDIRMSFLYFDPRIFVLARRLTPSQTLPNRILWFIDHYPYHPRK